MAEVEATFRAYAAERAIDLAGVTAAQAVNLMTDWYERQRVDDVSDQDGDMLLFQWGTYDWGDGPSFQYDITRQLIRDGGEDDDIFQLSLTVHAAPTAEAKAIGSDNRWCESPAGLDEMRTFIGEAPATEFMRTAQVVRVDLHYECAG